MARAFDILVVGELNVDLIMDGIAGFPKLEAEILCNSMALTMGGSSAIFACNASSLGSKVKFCGRIGQDPFGALVMSELHKKRVETSSIKEIATDQTGATVALSFGEKRAMVTYPGVMRDLSLQDIPDSDFSAAQHLHISSIFLQPKLFADLKLIFAKAKKKGMTTSLDTQWDPSEQWAFDIHGILPLVDVFLPNAAEAMALAGTSSVDLALDRLAEVGNLVVIKEGARGSRAKKGSEIFHSGPFINDQVVDAIGAGDSFDAGFVWAYVKGLPVDRCLQAGNLAGALNTTAAGGTAAFIDLDSIRKTAKLRFGMSESIF
ncbi:MAG: carbohydrate kinase family protein [Bdellovibrionales bacterium]